MEVAATPLPQHQILHKHCPAHIYLPQTMVLMDTSPLLAGATNQLTFRSAAQYQLNPAM